MSEKGEKLDWYLPRRYRSPMTFKGLLAFEFLLTIALLALFGIAAPDLYRTRLWQDGSDNGFNSSPDEMMYTIANYRPYSEPKVWSQFLTNFNLVISVLSMFILLVKAPMFVLNVFYPPLSAVLHGALLALYIVSAIYQAGSDTSDPKHPQNGPPWYLTKNCNVARFPKNVGYCKQAKASFACTIIALVVFVAHIVLAAISCLPTEEIREKQREKAERIETLAELKSLKSPGFPTGENGLPLMTPRTVAFNKLSGTTDLPFRTNAEYYQPDVEDEAALKQHQQYQQQQQHHYQEPQLQQPQPQQAQLQPQPQMEQHQAEIEPEVPLQPHAQPPEEQQQQPTMYFPPPPKKAKK